jgi:hypothetical protein
MPLLLRRKDGEVLIAKIVNFIIKCSQLTTWRTGWTGDTEVKMLMTLERRRKTEDGIFGIMSLDFNPFQCFTIENLAKAIPAGLYDVTFDYSPRFNRVMPHVIVPARDQAAGGDAGIRIHWGNVPGNYEGCIGVGDKEEPDAIDDTVATFNQLYKIISPIASGLKLQIVDIKEAV